MKTASSSLTFAKGRPRSSGACALAAFGRWSVVTAQPPCSVHGWVGHHTAGTCTQHPIALAGGGGSGCAGGSAATSLRADEATGGGRRAYDSDQLHTSRASSARLCRSSTRGRAAAHIKAGRTKPRAERRAPACAAQAREQEQQHISKPGASVTPARAISCARAEHRAPACAAQAREQEQQHVSKPSRRSRGGERHAC